MKHLRDVWCLSTARSPGIQLRIAWIVVASLLLYIFFGNIGIHNRSPVSSPLPPVYLSFRPPEMQRVVAKRPHILVFGDSLTQHGSSPNGGWVAALQDHYSRKADVVNRGFSGYNTRLAVHLPAHILEERSAPPILMTFFFGANDAALQGRVGYRQHVSVAQYTHNLRSMVEVAAKSGVTNTILITPPPVCDEGRVQHQAKVAVDVPEGLDVTLPDRTNSHTRQYAEAVIALAKELNVPCIDLHTSMQQRDGWEQYYLQADGLHFTPAGNMFVFGQLVNTVNKHFPQIRSEDLPFHFPPWATFNTTDPQQVVEDVMNGKLS